MPPSKPFDWGRVVKPLRWTARIVAGVPYVLWAGFSLTYHPGGAGGGVDAKQWVVLGVLGCGLVLAMVWKGLGEVIGGLALVGGGLAQGFLYLPPQTGELAAGALFAVPGLLFIACGWYTLAQGRHHMPGATA